MRINFKQIITLLLFLIIPIDFIESLYGVGVNLNITTLMLCLLFLYACFRAFWLLATPLENKIIFKNDIQKVIPKGICPLCKSNFISSNMLKIGYRKRHWAIGYMIFYISYSTSCSELFTHINICNECTKKYKKISNSKFLFIFARNPSKKLLKQKYGYRLGIQFPFESWNISKQSDTYSEFDETSYKEFKETSYDKKESQNTNAHNIEDYQEIDDSNLSESEKDKIYASLFGLKGKITKSELKQIYKKLIGLYHPDKVSHLGKEFQIFAEKKTKDINKAYSYFKKKYNL